MRNKSLTPIATAAVMELSLLVGMRRGGEEETKAPLRDVVEHYDSFMKLGLTGNEKSDLLEDLKSL